MGQTHNPVVKHLLDSPRDQYLTNRSGFPNKERLDDERPPEKTYCPLVADSSQLAAVIAATEGMDFVLLGPPGTGKSQTISNMISQCLAEGKTVLFVSEKMAALDVVHRRLKETGIGEFCLELHSNKARGATVLQQLKQAMEIKGDLTAIKWQEEANRLKTLRDRLNLYVRRLHHNYPNGWSVYRAIGEVVFNQDLPKIAFSWASIHKHNIADFNDLLDIAKRIDANSEQVGEIINNPFRDVLRGEWSPSWQADLITAAKDMMPTVSELRHAFKQYLNVTSLQISQPNYNQLQNILRLNKLLLSAYTMPFGFAVSPKSSVIVKDVKNAIQHLKNYRKSWDSLTTNYKRTVTELNIEELENDWNTANTFWWGKKWVWQNRIRKCMQIHVENNKKPDSAEKEFSGIKNAAKYEAEFNKLNYLSSHLDKLWSGLDTDIKGLNSAVEWGEQAQKLIEVFSYNADTLTSLKSSLSKLIVEGNDLLSPKGILEQCGDALELKVNEFNSSLNKGLSLTDAENGLLFSPEKNNYLECIEQQCQDWLNSETKLRYWCAWRGIRQKAIGASLGNLVLAIENGQTLGHSSEKLFQVNYSRWFLNKAVDQDDVLRTFVPAEHEHWLKEFKQLDRDFLKLTSQYVRAKISGQIPDDHDGPQREEWSTLNRELQKRSRHLPLRKLIQKMPTTLTKVAPCLMMSPLSIAQFLPAETVPFDVVIFDEASQITSWDAVGAIARGKQTIVVGDPKQLPPTSFFQRRDDESPDQDTEMEDLESILDECVGARIPVLELNWHYRSRSEHLITFSNHRYYSGRLVTFPSANTDDKAVQYHYVENSVYARGGGRINEVEGKAIVNAVVDRLRDSNFVDTIGIVTFNTEQQTLIEDLFEKKRKEYPEIESHFAEDKIESIFVKNIESVQGDERDIIYFSLTYGRDIKGVFSMNFGPINKAGGQRRLNVAITRSRKEMHVFSGMRPEEMDLSRTNSEGVKDLKHFMEFADRGPRALAEVIDRPLEDYDSPFEEAVACALSDRGWIVHSQVGVSSFRIDLGVVNPDEQGSYLAGVECDGATYHRSATARDRDLLREQVLIGLGWNILRIWSTDWWTDPIGATEKIHKSLEGLLEDSRNIRRAEEAEKNAQTQADSNVDVNNEQKPDSDEVVSDFSPGLISDDALEIKNEEPNTHPQKESVSRDEFSLVSEPHQGKLNITSKENIVSEPIDQKAYSHEGLIINQEPYITFEAADLADPSSSSKGKISEGLCRIVEVEGPMLAKKAYDIYLRSCGIRRLGGTLQKTMNKAMQYAIRCGKIEKEDESKKGGIIYSIVRANNTSPIKLRRLGTRSFCKAP